MSHVTANPRPATRPPARQQGALRFAEGGDADIKAYEKRRATVARQPPDIQSMTHVGDKPRRPVEVDTGYFGKVRAGDAPYDVSGPLSGALTTAYGLKTLPLYMTPAAPVAAASDLAEGIASGDPLQAAMGIAGGPVGKGAARAIGAVGGMTAFPNDAEAISLGVLARRPPMSALKGAEAMRQRGAPREWIHQDTGIHYGIDGHPRWEMDDSPVAMDPKALRLPGENRGPRAAEDVLNYPELWSQYPDIGRNVGIEVRRLNGPQAVWDEGQRQISVSPMASNPLSSVMHELQHAIQSKEGWAGGASQSGLQAWMHEAHLQRLRMLEGAGYKPRPDLTPEEAREYARLRSEYSNSLDPGRMHRTYQRSAGEVEARNTQTRLFWDDDMRRETPPWQSADVAESRQILHPSLPDMSRQYQMWRTTGMPEAERDRLMAYAREIGATDEPFKRSP